MFKLWHGVQKIQIDGTEGAPNFSKLKDDKIWLLLHSLSILAKSKIEIYNMVPWLCYKLRLGISQFF